MPDIPEPLLSVILVNYNGRDLLQRCLTAVVTSLPNEKKEILVVDNASTDGSREFMRTFFPKVNVITNAKNLGFGAANNQGAAVAKGRFFLFLNTDTVVYPGALERLFEEFEKEKKTAAAGPALVGEQGELQVSWGDKIHFFSELWKKVLGNRLSATRMRGNKEGKDVRWLSGACLMVRREAWNQSSGFDENFFLYFEDIDLCFRFHDLGWKLRYVPSSLVFHQGGASTEAMKMESRLHYRSSQLYFYKKHNHWISRAGLKLYFYLEYAGLSLSGRWKEKEHLRSWYRRLLKEK